MDHIKQRQLSGATAAPEVLIAYVYGETPPDFAAIAAFGFTVVCLDTSAPWFRDTTVGDAKAHGLTPVAFRMGFGGSH
jgi:hypothetical protein